MIQLVKILFFVAFCTPCWSQIPAEEPIGYIYRSHWSLGPRLATNGFGFEFNYEKRGTDKFRHSFHVSINKIKAQKETRTTNPFYEDSKAYVFGKINQLYAGHLSYGGSWKLFEKKRLNGISIRFNQQLGLSAGLVQPIYLKIKEPFSSLPSVAPTEERYDPTIHPESHIYGRAPGTKGFSESQFQAGMYIKSGIQFDFNPNKDAISAVELGGQLEMYSKKVPLFYTGKNHQIFPSLYATVLFGKNKI